MSLAKFSSDFLIESFTLLDNLFIVEHLPYLDATEIKVYVYGLYLSLNPSSDNSVEKMAKTLGVESADIMQAYTYFEDCGLVRILSREPLEVSYLSLKRANQPPKKFKSDKFSDFAHDLELLMPERTFTPNEFNEYFGFLDSSKMEPNALLMIVQYCKNLKGDTVRYPYVLTVARAWSTEGVKTADDVERKLTEYEAQSEDMRAVLHAMGRKGGADLDEKQMLLKWMRSWGFELDAVITAAKPLKSKTFKALDKRLDEFYRMSIFTAAEMKDYAARKEHLIDLTIDINKTIGVYYESLDHEIEYYVTPWTLKGFEDDALKKIAHYCFLCGIKTLEGVNGFVNKFYQDGLLSAQAVDEYIALQVKNTAKIKSVIEASGRTRNVTQSDRDFYHTWSEIWGYSDDVILYAAEQSRDKIYPVPFINQLLTSWRSAGVKSVDEAKKQIVSSSPTPGSTKKHESNYTEREYKPEDLQAIFGASNVSDIQL